MICLQCTNLGLGPRSYKTPALFACNFPKYAQSQKLLQMKWQQHRQCPISSIPKTNPNNSTKGHKPNPNPTGLSILIQVILLPLFCSQIQQEFLPVATRMWLKQFGDGARYTFSHTCAHQYGILYHVDILFSDFTHGGIKGALTWGTAPLGEFGSGHYKLPGMDK